MSRQPDYSDEPELLPTGSPAGAEPSSNASELNLKVQLVQEQLLDLKRQQEEIEHQKRELEELTRKQREFDEGRRDIVEKLTRGLVLLERQNFETQRELEQIRQIHDSFTEQLSLTEGINPSDWAAQELPGELTKALARVDQAKVVYGQSRARLATLREAEEGEADLPPDLAPELAPEEKSFGAMVREGFAYSLPLLIVLILVLIVFLATRH